MEGKRKQHEHAAFIWVFLFHVLFRWPLTVRVTPACNSFWLEKTCTFTITKGPLQPNVYKVVSLVII